jgi:hypothetical protein
VVNITNTGAFGASLQSGTSGSVPGSICVNAYAFSPDEQIVDCCSCPVTPDGLVSLSGRGDLTSNSLIRGVQTSLVVKLLATIPIGGTCTNSALGVTTASLAPGMAAWGATLHSNSATAGRQFDLTEKAFVPSNLSVGELGRLNNTCNLLVAQGSGFGICNSCRLGAAVSQ